MAAGFSRRLLSSDRVLNIRNASFSRSCSTSLGANYNKVRVLHDGECPICVKEIRFVKWMDTKKQNIDFVDISKDYNAEDNQGIPIEDAMSVLHVIEDGKIYTSVAAMHKLYGAVGLQWLWAWTKIPGISSMVDRLYSWFAKNRLRFTGREWCETGRCTVKIQKSQ